MSPVLRDGSLQGIQNTLIVNLFTTSPLPRMAEADKDPSAWQKAKDTFERYAVFARPD